MKKLLTVALISALILTACSLNSSVNKGTIGDEDIVSQDSGTKTYANAELGYSFQYPEEAQIGGEDMENNSKVPVILKVYTDDVNPLFRFQRKTSDFIKDENKKDQLVNEYYSLGLKDYVQKIWEMNKNDTNPNVEKEVGDIENITRNNLVFRGFKISGSYEDELGGRILDYPQVFMFTESVGGIYQLNFPDTDEGRKVFESFTIN